MIGLVLTWDWLVHYFYRARNLHGWLPAPVRILPVTPSHSRRMRPLPHVRRGQGHWDGLPTRLGLQPSKRTLRLARPRSLLQCWWYETSFKRGKGFQPSFCYNIKNHRKLFYSNFKLIFYKSLEFQSLLFTKFVLQIFNALPQSCHSFTHV